MSEKILSVVVCAYNMEKYIERALKSCIIDQKMEQLEVLIMNDGSTDRTALIAQKYCEKYPKTFVLINKENGGWGTNINKAVEIATGKYFKILDADDWFETDVLLELMNKLEKSEVDMILTHHQEGMPKKMKVSKHNWGKYHGMVVSQNDVDVPLVMSIWDVAFRTQVVREQHINLPAKTFYTDVMFSLQCMFGVKKVYFYDKILYNYYFGRADQSVSIVNQKKHSKEAVYVVKESIDRYIRKKNKYGSSKFALQRLTNTYNEGIFRRFVRISDDKHIQCKKVIQDMDMMIKEKLPELYIESNRSKIVKILRITNYRGIGILRVIGNLTNRI